MLTVTVGRRMTFPLPTQTRIATSSTRRRVPHLQPRPPPILPAPTYEQTIPKMKIRKFLPEEDARILEELRRAHEVGKPASQFRIAKQLGRCQMSIEYRIAVLNGKFKTGPYTVSEDGAIREHVRNCEKGVSAKDWKIIGTILHRNPDKVKQRWNESLSKALKQGPWENSENSAIVAEGIAAAKESRNPKWKDLGDCPFRGPAAIASRWHNNLNPTLKKGKWSSKEDDIVTQAVAETLQRHARINWAEIGRMLHRAGDGVRQRWKCVLESDQKQKVVTAVTDVTCKRSNTAEKTLEVKSRLQ